MQGMDAEMKNMLLARGIYIGNVIAVNDIK